MLYDDRWRLLTTPLQLSSRRSSARSVTGFGRRPASRTPPAPVYYLVMAFSPFGWVLVVGPGAGHNNQRQYGGRKRLYHRHHPGRTAGAAVWQVGAVMSLGFVIGPVIGGVLGAWWLRSPFLAAAAFNGSIPVGAVRSAGKPQGQPRRSSRSRTQSAGAAGLALEFKRLLPLVAIFVVFGLVAAIPGTDLGRSWRRAVRLGPVHMGLSLSAFGASGALVQLLVGASATWGHLDDRIAFSTCCYARMAFASQGWMGYAVSRLSSHWAALPCRRCNRW